MLEERDRSKNPLSNTLSSNDKYLPDADIYMVALPDKMEKPAIPHLKTCLTSVDGFCLIFREYNECEYWICEEKKKGSYFVQCFESRDSKPQKIH